MEFMVVMFWIVIDVISMKKKMNTLLLMMLLKDLPMIDIDSKKMLYMKYNYNRDKKLVRKRG